MINLKNLDFLLESLKILKELNVDFKLLMVGSGPDEDKMKNLIKRLRLEAISLWSGKLQIEKF